MRPPPSLEQKTQNASNSVVAFTLDVMLQNTPWKREQTNTNSSISCI